ncbi:MAG TPA: hypothetical protein VKB86_00895, partial [Pyrinomonadaceae bacterium]|nr:hypothetical protein [Pyrinomonadaceae bacterium]
DIIETGEGTPYRADQYGPHGIIVMEPTAGEAALAEANGRFTFFIQGGARATNERLRATNGALRLHDEDHKELLTAVTGLTGLTCQCVQASAAEDAALIEGSPAYDEGDPPPMPQRSSIEQEWVTPRAALFNTAEVVAYGEYGPEPETETETEPEPEPSPEPGPTPSEPEETETEEPETATEPTPEPGPTPGPTDTSDSSTSTDEDEDDDDEDHFSTKDDSVNLAPETQEKAAAIAQDFFDSTGKELTITDGTRTTEDQAERMYDKLASGKGVGIYKDQEAAGEIKDAYDQGVEDGKSKDEIIEDMKNVIDNQVSNGTYISNHLNERAFDVRSSGMTAAEIEAFRSAVEANGGKVINEGDHLHVQY